ncbi:hypothetical protein HOV23_gp085 [Pseudomonas phage Lana]|uniref:Uncharacterized protein n=1 Tax=Pseudomonas phage Lana TaxID=2530172 RepID=A0A481W771_9CAUD|nr:hypothetical protein HOV23_gp085 [Pseudomonas phage Lana]QBJ04488.1 hypothetical protein [Pseudomonas phage Lana]
MGLSHRTIETPVFKFDQLSEKAQAHALEKNYERNVDHEWWDSTYDDAVMMAAVMGIEIENRRGSNPQPAIWFSGFSSQGDGACFEGTYRYRKGALKALKSEAPARYKNTETKQWVDVEGNVELHAICRGLQDVQSRHFYKLEADVKQRGHYNHSGCTHIEVTHSDDQYRDLGEDEELIKQLLRDFMDWIYARLEKEYEYLTSEEQLKESLIADEVEFDEEGNRV